VPRSSGVPTEMPKPSGDQSNSSDAPPPHKPSFKNSELLQVYEEALTSKHCGLCELRTNLVFGDGNPESPIMFVGEAPGENEDHQGRPFVGPAGELLTRMIQAMGYKREEVYIANVVKCRPPGNRNPTPEEVKGCLPFLERQIDIIKPRVIVALGTFAAQALLKTDEKISKIRGQLIQARGTQILATFHPAYLLRNPDAKKQVWEDLQEVMRFLGPKS
jgi:uracil-DNA glycosylase